MPSPSSSPNDSPSSNMPTHDDIPVVTVESCAEYKDFNLASKHKIHFKYEIVTPDYINVMNFSRFNSVIETLENRILEHLADEFLSCNNHRRRTRSTTQRSLEKNTPDIIQLEARPKDKVDIVDVRCINDFNVEGPSSCTPMVGAMTFYTDCTAATRCTFPREEILWSIEQSCLDDIYVDGDEIKQINYIGDALPKKHTTSIGTAGDLNSGSITWAFSLGLGAATIATILLYFYKRKKMSERFDDISMDHGDDDHLEKGYEGVTFNISIATEGDSKLF